MDTSIAIVGFRSHYLTKPAFGSGRVIRDDSLLNNNSIMFVEDRASSASCHFAANRSCQLQARRRIAAADCRETCLQKPLSVSGNLVRYASRMPENCLVWIRLLSFFSITKDVEIYTAEAALAIVVVERGAWLDGV